MVVVSSLISLLQTSGMHHIYYQGRWLIRLSDNALPSLKTTEDQKFVTTSRSRFSIWSLTQLLYIIAVNTYITSIFHRSNDESGGSVQLLLTGASMALTYMVLAHSTRSTISSELDRIETYFPTEGILVAQFASFSLGIATILMVFMGDRSRSLSVILALGVAQAVQWSSIYCLVRSPIIVPRQTTYTNYADDIWFPDSLHD